MTRLSLYLLGTPRIERDGLPISVDTRKAIALLAYIAITGESHRRDALVNLLWPESDQTHGRSNLRRTLYALRQASVGDCLDAGRDTVCLNPGADIWLDVDQFRGHLAHCLTHGHAANAVCPDCLQPLADAVALYRGDFMCGFSLKDSVNFDDWQLYQVDILRGELANALDRLVQAHIRQGAFEAALESARRWLALDRLNEAAHCQLMRLYAWSDQRSAAIRQYQECVKLLKTELQIHPQESTTRLYKAIQQGYTPGPPSGLDIQVVPEREDAAAVAEPPSTPREPRSARAPLGVFVARKRELALLFRHLGAALAGQGQPVFVIGGPGRGKTTLVQEFAQRAQERWGQLVFAGGNCNAHTGFGDPYLPFREILGLLTGDVDALWAAGSITEEHARRLWDAFPSVVEALLEVGPDLIDTFIPGAALLRRAAAYTTGGIRGRVPWLARLEELVGHKAAIPADPNLLQSALFEQYVRVMILLSRLRPLLLAVDDLQWADTGSINLLFHLGRGVAGSRILIIGAYRPEEVALPRGGERNPLESVIHEFERNFGSVAIDLAQAEDRLFVEEYLDTEPNQLSAGFRETLFHQTKGHPLFTVELLRGMQERGDLIYDDAGRWVEGPALDWEKLPTRAEAVIAERIDRLNAVSRDALRVASVEGEIFTAEVVARVCSVNDREMVERLSDELSRTHRLVRAQEIQRLGSRSLSRYRFRHILFQNYLYHSLDPVQRMHLHEAVGTALEALYGDEADEIAVPLARHFQEAGTSDKAITYLLKAGEKAKRSSANEAAIAHLTKGLELLEATPDTSARTQRELDLLVAMGIPLVLTKGHAAVEVEQIYSKALALSAHVGDTHQRFQALMGLRRFYLHREKVRRAHELGEQLLALAQSAGDDSLASRAHMMHAESLYCLGEFVQAREHCQKGLALYDPQGWRSHVFLYGNDTGIGCRIFEAIALWPLGYPDRALTAARAGLSLAADLSHPFTHVFALYFAATVHQFRREVAAVQEKLDRLLEISEKQGFALYLAWGTMLQGWALAVQGQPEPGIAQLQHGLRAWHNLGAGSYRPYYLLLLAETYGRVGKAGEGLNVLAEALAEVEETGERTFEAELHRLKGELLLMTGADQDQAETCFQRALEVARRQRARSWELRAALSLSRLWHAEGARDKSEQAGELLQGIYEWFTEGHDTADLKEAKALLDLLAEYRVISPT